jgi:hypothetical protein
VENIIEGSGSYRWPDSAVYTGSWLGGKMHGKGTYTDQFGATFAGDYFNGYFDSGRSYVSLRPVPDR